MESFKKQSWEEKKLEDPTIKERDVARQGSSELQRSIAEVQSARYETTLYRLMERSGNNPELINALDKFTNILDARSYYGVNDEPFAPIHVKKLTQFFEEKTKEMDSPNFYR